MRKPMRAARLAAMLLPIGLAGCALLEAEQPGCVGLFQQYDRLERSGYDGSYDRRDGTWQMAPELSRQTRRLITNDCLTRSEDLDGLEAFAARNAGFRIARGGAPIRAVPVHLGVVTGIGDEWVVTRTFRGFGYRSRGVGAQGLGRRIYIGPFTDQAALDQALALAREAGFVAPYAATQTRF